MYHNLKRLKLDRPEQVFDIEFFRRKPSPFYELAHELYPGKFAPTKTHSFIRLLHEKGILLRCFTQNIDTLERRAGIPAELIVEAHGSFASNHCISPKCGKEADYEATKGLILQKKIPRCTKCKELVKPDIVFFGEGLPKIFFQRMEEDMPKADLLIVMGTSLQVQPFSLLPELVSRDCPRLLLNLEEVGNFSRDLDVIRLINTDSGCQELADACGWKQDLEDLNALIKKDNTPEELPAQAGDVEPAKQEEVKSEVTKDDESLEKAHSIVDDLAKQLKGTNL